ncbi:MAG TPA: SDR family NAD(P)-dependent oxidoreductase [Acidimicrobiales bacterium]|nr:SDR family NAD(P)-dependent oxidoreductase [Acidimicrobiales bacterium]
MTNHVDGRTIVITGAGGGFGRLVAQKTAALGGRVAVADIDLSAADETVGLVEAEGGAAFSALVDVADRTQMVDLARETVARYGSIDVMVNNAGVMPLAMYADHAQAADAWDHCIDVNLKGVLNGIIAVHDQMIEQGRGQIVNISSIYGNYPVTGAAVYGATKAAVAFLSEALRQESVGKIKVTTIRPTGVPTTGLGGGVINQAAIAGVVGGKLDDFMETMVSMFSGEGPPHLTDADDIGYFALSADLLADSIIHVINQPWGVSISDLSVRASGDSYVI